MALAKANKRVLDVEKSMQALIEVNIAALFPSLKLLKAEFRGTPGGGSRPDIIAFDTSRNTFAVIEVKNRPNEKAVDQARTYLSDMKRYKGELVLLHSKNMKCSPRDEQSFNWNEMYAIIMAPKFSEDQISMAPKFSEDQISMANEDQTVELYEVTMYNKHAILVEQVNGNHREVPPRPAGPTSGSAQLKSEPTARLLLPESFFTIKAKIRNMSGTTRADSPPLSDEEIKDIDYFYNHPEEHRVLTLKELLEELHSA